MRVVTVIAALTLFASNTFAQETGENSWLCQEDRARFCADVRPNDGRIIACLKNHRPELSEACGKILFGLNPAGPSAQESPSPTEAKMARAAASELKQTYGQISQALTDCDVNKLMVFVAPNAEFVDIQSARKTSEEYKADIVKLFSRSRNNTCAFTLQEVQADGNKATASMGEVCRLDVRSNNRWVPIIITTTSEDIWEKTSGAWKMTRSHILRQQQTINPEYLAAMRTDANTARAVASELKQIAQPLAGVEAGHPYPDLAAFGKAVGEARIVSLGEATHGTREFFQMKHRLLEYLVREKSFTVFAIEANWPESLAVDRYIKTGEGDPKAALSGMYFWTWNTTEVLDMIEWMRAFNAAPGQHPILSFTSFDMQTADVAANHVLVYLRKADPQQAQAAETAYAGLAKLREQPQEPSKDVAGSVAQRAAEVVAAMDSKREALIGATSPEAWRDARQAAEIARQAASLRTPGINTDYRDEMMARNVEWLADQAYPGQKMVLWAHNAHVSLGSDGSYKLMGAWLRLRFGTDMYVLGFQFRGGTARAISTTADGKFTGLKDNLLPVSPEGGGDAVLSAARLPLFFLDLRSVPNEGALGRWLSEQHPFRSFGAVWYEQTPDLQLQPEVLTELYDGIIFVEDTHPAQGLPFVNSMNWPCKEDRARHCAGVQPGGGRIIACLKDHRPELDEACGKFIASQ
jgi:erythromycin esterase